MVTIILGGCSGPDGPDFYDLSHGPLDQGVPPGSDLSATGLEDLAAPPIACDEMSNPCPDGQRCFHGACGPDNGTCHVDNDCENDTWCGCARGGVDGGACSEHACVPWGTPPRGSFDPGCAGQTFMPTPLATPQVHCHWPIDNANSSGTLSTPVVADLDGDHKPEIIFPVYPNRLVALHGADCTVLFDVFMKLAERNQSQIAVADLDADGAPEIVALDGAHRVIVLDRTGKLVATAPTPYTDSKLPGEDGGDWSGPAIADLDGAAPPEIIVAGQVSRYAAGQITVLWTQPVATPYFGALSIAADLDGDGKLEVIAGAHVFDGLTGADRTPAPLAMLQGPAAYPAIGDFNGDHNPDLVLVQSGLQQSRFSIYDFANQRFLVGPHDLPGGHGGPPAVADFDGDGAPEVAVAGPSSLYLFKAECEGPMKARGCDPFSPLPIVWAKPIQDASSGATGVSAFDLNGDGSAEVIYRDECWLRIYRGSDGSVAWAASITSTTALEEPTIADVDSDGHADIVVASDSYVTGTCPMKAEADSNAPWTGYSTGIFVYSGPLDKYAPARSVWNQHAYHGTNVADDLTVPAAEVPSWTPGGIASGGYRENSSEQMQAMPMPRADFTAGAAPPGAPQKSCLVAWTLRAQICNRGAIMAFAGVPGTFYNSAPHGGGPPICTTRTAGPLAPGMCEVVSCDWKNPLQGAIDLWFVADDDGKGGSAADLECRRTNNQLVMPASTCT